MTTNNSTTHIGKRMPYSVPAGYFDTLNAEIMQQLAQQAPSEKPNSRKRLWRIITTTLSTAAVVTIAAVITHNYLAPPTTAEKIANYDQQIDQAFNHLSQTDQDYLLSVYQDNLYIDDINEQL